MLQAFPFSINACVLSHLSLDIFKAVTHGTLSEILREILQGVDGKVVRVGASLFAVYLSCKNWNHLHKILAPIKQTSLKPSLRCCSCCPTGPLHRKLLEAFVENSKPTYQHQPCPGVLQCGTSPRSRGYTKLKCSPS